MEGLRLDDCAEQPHVSMHGCLCVHACRRAWPQQMCTADMLVRTPGAAYLSFGTHTRPGSLSPCAVFHVTSSFLPQSTPASLSSGGPSLRLPRAPPPGRRRAPGLLGAEPSCSPDVLSKPASVQISCGWRGRECVRGIPGNADPWVDGTDA